MRVLIAQREFEGALEIEPPDGFERISSGMRGEWLACRALALAGAGAHGEAESLADQALSTTASLETAGVAGAAKAILRARVSKLLAPEAEEWLAKIIEWRYLDALLLATRAYPSLLASLHQSEMASELLDVLRRADSTVVPAVPDDKDGPESDDVLSLLSKRELEVCELLGRGMTNREIAQTLFISETTVKVHVRHIFKKLGVRSRTEVALVGATLQLQ
jgi:DNA-binding CsgD family transcriptional regulator